VELLGGLAGAHVCGFHAARWARRFQACCAGRLGVEPATLVAAAAPDSADLYATAASPACDAEVAQLDAFAGERQLIARVDRMEPSKNVLRGFWAFDELLERRPQWRERVSFAAMVYPSRQGLPDYLAYAREVAGLAERVNQRWATPSWTPIWLSAEDNHPRSVAALRRADVVLVNPVRDGLNLVAMETSLVNEHAAGLVLSRQAGSWDTLGDWAHGINPFDVSDTASALDAALSATPAERHARAAGLRAAVDARSSLDWWDEQLAAARR
jgi:trehalose 6-phosphate synthase